MIAGILAHTHLSLQDELESDEGEQIITEIRLALLYEVTARK